jgi:uncharacterized protein YjbI with pentapeptide repeats
MADKEHLKIIRQGVAAWNKWRKNNPGLIPDLTQARLVKADLTKANLSHAHLLWANLFGANLTKANLAKAMLDYADLTGADLLWADLFGANLFDANLFEARLLWADLTEANLSHAHLLSANLSEANLTKANLHEAMLREANLWKAILTQAILTQARLLWANLFGANLTKANLQGANLTGADLSEARLYEADLSGADLTRARLIETDLCNATLFESRVYGASVWNIKVNDQTNQQDLIITRHDEPVITVDNVKVAQFIYLLLNNKEIRDVIETIGEKGVLILGRFTPERKKVLDGIRNRLRELGFVPMMFDFERPKQLDFTETIMVLAGLSRFIIADITNPASSPLELDAIMPDYMIPFVPIIQEGEKPFSMFQDLNNKYDKWVLKVLEYDSAENLIKVLGKAVVEPALEKSQELILKKAEEIQTRHVKDFMAGGPTSK